MITEIINQPLWKYILDKSHLDLDHLYYFISLDKKDLAKDAINSIRESLDVLEKSLDDKDK